MAQVICKFCGHAIARPSLDNITCGDKYYSVFFCDKCEIGMTVPEPDNAQMSKLYEVGKYREKKGRRFVPFVEYLILTFRHSRRRRIERFRKNGRILDIGCGRGLFLHIMRQCGWDVSAVEFDEITASNISETFGIHCISGHPELWSFSESSFDVITLNHVLEHVPWPLEMLNKCTALLKPDGLIVIAVPNFSSIQATYGKDNWFHLDIPYHLSHFTEDGLIRIIEQRGFEIVRVRRFDLEYSPFGWLQSLLNSVGVKKNILYSYILDMEWSKKLIKDVPEFYVLIVVFLFIFFAPISLFLSLYESYVKKRGGVIEIFAMKKKTLSATIKTHDTKII
ncbi:class I SAM-dependent methyltransferase [Candidatus Magnetomonas plexicatena]|uniref:class I SAM-dependent methyltransferase n=1 Tax=Candidatus Magnetomonas plexicatena TaxID=2552947 RepID=UPI001101316F|nr:class I SAM-dependent methyltransferase [Nitrospirales bacterium LBB_01]